MRMLSYIFWEVFWEYPQKIYSTIKWGKWDWVRDEVDLQCCATKSHSVLQGTPGPGMTLLSYPKSSLGAESSYPSSVIDHRPWPLGRVTLGWDSSQKLRAILVEGIAMIHWEQIFPALEDVIMREAGQNLIIHYKLHMSAIRVLTWETTI